MLCYVQIINIDEVKYRNVFSTNSIIFDTVVWPTNWKNTYYTRTRMLIKYAFSLFRGTIQVNIKYQFLV